MANLEGKTIDQIRAEVKSLISEIIEVPETQIGDYASFADDLDVDSLMALEIVASIEKKYRVQIPEENLQRVKTFNDTVALVQEFI